MAECKRCGGKGYVWHPVDPPFIHSTPTSYSIHNAVEVRCPDCRPPIVQELLERGRELMPDYSHSSLGRPWIASRRQIG